MAVKEDLSQNDWWQDKGSVANMQFETVQPQQPLKKNLLNAVSTMLLLEDVKKKPDHTS